MKKRDILKRIEQLETRLALVENRSPVVWPCVEPMPVYPFWSITVGDSSGGIGSISTGGTSAATNLKG